jgi:hypothetical protein
MREVIALAFPDPFRFWHVDRKLVAPHRCRVTAAVVFKNARWYNDDNATRLRWDRNTVTHYEPEVTALIHKAAEPRFWVPFR